MNGPLLLAAAFFLSLLTTTCALGWRFYVLPARIRDRLGDSVVTGHISGKPGKSLARKLGDMLQTLGARLPAGPSVDAIRRQLVMAGYRSANAPQVFLGLTAASVSILLLAAIAMPFSGDSNPAVRPIMIVGAAGIGWRLPGFILRKKIGARQERLRLLLPDALDLIIIALQAGLGLDQAIQHVAQEIGGNERNDLSDELLLIGMEMRAGMRRADALRAFSDRTGEEEIQKLVAILIQNDKFGTGMAEAMRSHSQFMRVQRRQQAEERAAKVGVKLVFPIFFFILPSMMLVAAGPGILQIFKFLFPMMKQSH